VTKSVTSALVGAAVARGVIASVQQPVPRCCPISRQLGQLYLDDGMRAGRQVLPRDWVRESTRTWLAAPSYGRQYGWLWWIRSAPGAGDVAEAWGTCGQHIFVVRPMNLVVGVIARDNNIDGGTQILDEIVAAAA